MTELFLCDAAGVLSARPVHCDFCDWTGRAEDTDAIADAHDRLTPGAVVPAGQCPVCRALAYLDEAKEPAPEAPPSGPFRRYRVRVVGEETCTTTRDRYVLARSVEEASEAALGSNWLDYDTAPEAATEPGYYDEAELDCSPDGFEPAHVTDVEDIDR